MAAIQEIPLAGVGLRRDFMTRLGDRIGVISYHTGQRDLLIYDRTAPIGVRSWSGWRSRIVIRWLIFSIQPPMLRGQPTTNA
jgi:hypothetical protein